MKEMVGGCCVCSDDRGWPENPLVYCDGQSCTVAVHQACYGIVTVPTGPWYCRKCESQERAVKVKCELCPSKYGALKRTDNGGWAHVVCALYIPEVRFGNVTTMEPIQLQLIPQERFNKVCYICEEAGKASNASVGACMQCNKSGCKQQFHVTCAQGLGLLCEEAGNYLDNVKYCGYCQHHYSKLKKGINIKTIPPYKPLPSETHQSDSSSEKDADSGTASNSTASANPSCVSSGPTVTTATTATSGNTATTIPNSPATGATVTATTGKRKYYSNNKTKIEKTTTNSNPSGSSNVATSSKTYQTKKTPTPSTQSSSTLDSKSSIGKSMISKVGVVSVGLVGGVKDEGLKVEVKVEVKKEVEDAVAAAAASAGAPSAKGKKRKANSRTPTPNIVIGAGISSDGVGDSVASVEKKDGISATGENKKVKPIDTPSPSPTTPTPPQTTPTATPQTHTPPITTITPHNVPLTTPTTVNITPIIATNSPSIIPTLATSSPVNSLVVSVPLMPLVPTPTAAGGNIVTQHSVSPRPIVTAGITVTGGNQQLLVGDGRVVTTPTDRAMLLLGDAGAVDARQQHQQIAQVLSGSLDINGPLSGGLLLEPDTMLTSELTGCGGLKIMFEKQTPTNSAFQAEIDRNTPTLDIPMKRSRSQSMEKSDKLVRSLKKRSSNSLASGSMAVLAPAASPVAGGALCGPSATPPPSAVATITKRTSRSQHPTPPPSVSAQHTVAAHYSSAHSTSAMLSMSLSTANQIKDSPPSSPSSESLGAPPVTVGRKKGRKSAPASVSSSSSSKDAKDTRDIKLFQNGVHAPHMLGNQLNPNSNMAQKMSDHLNSELEAHSIFTNTESGATLVGPQLHNRVLATARSSSTGGSSTASAGSGLSSMLGGGSGGAIPQTLDQLLERQWEQGSQFLMEQAQHFDIASLLSCLHQLRAENTRLEEHVSSLLQRRDHLLAVNARLAIPLTGPPATPQSSHPHSVNNIHPSVAANHSELTSRSSRHNSNITSAGTGAYTHSGVPLENGLPSDGTYPQQHRAQPSPTIRHSSGNYATAPSSVGSGLLRASESSSGRSSSSSRSQQQHYSMYQSSATQQMSMRGQSDMHHQSSSKPS